MPPGPTPETKSPALHSLLNQLSQLCKANPLIRFYLYSVTCHNSPFLMEHFPKSHAPDFSTYGQVRKVGQVLKVLLCPHILHLSVAPPYPENQVQISKDGG